MKRFFSVIRRASIWKLFFLLCVYLSAVALADTVESVYSKASLDTNYHTVQSGQEFLAYIRVEHPKGWHSYWTNPGDSGFPTRITWDLPEYVEAGDLLWADPETFFFESLLSYGYTDFADFVVPIRVSEEFNADSIDLKATVRWLVCKTECVPETVTLTQKVMINPSESVRSSSYNRIHNALISRQREGRVASFEIEDNVLLLSIPLLESELNETLYFFLEEEGVSAPTLDQEIEIIDSRAVFRFLLFDGVSELSTVSGILTIGDEDSVTVLAEVREAETLGVLRFLLFCVFAFLGGLVLNIMPCVFPILSLKLLGILEKTEAEKSLIRRQAFYYGLGIVISFFVMVTLLVVLKQIGFQFGWGFQLQQPLFVFLLLHIMLLVGLHLNGLFILPNWIESIAAKSMGRSSLKEGVSKDFFTGVLAVFLATPCTAPFMATAIAVALSQNWLVMYAIFMCLAIGFALPYYLVALLPFLQKLLPKPGSWMLTVKHGLALLMYGSVIWLGVTLRDQIGSVAFSYVGITVLAWGVYSYFQRRGMWLKRFGVLFVIVVLGLSFWNLSHQLPLKRSDNEIAFSELNQLLEEKKRVFVDVGATWCITCKVNENLIIHSKEIKDFFEEENVSLIVLDWTNHDSQVTEYLQSFDRQGVPLYIYYNESGETSILPVVLTKEIVKSHLLR